MIKSLIFKLLMLNCDYIDQMIDYEIYICNEIHENEKNDNLIKIKQNCQSINNMLDFYFDYFENQCDFDNSDFSC